MVSSSSQRSRPSVDYIEESNSTANLFLGGARRAWMPDGGPICPRNCDPQLPANTDARPDALSQGQQAALMSLVTPAAILQPSVTLADKPDAPTALPSPVPSTNSHPSPIGAHNRPSAPSTAPDRLPVAVCQIEPNGHNVVHPCQPVTVALQNPSMATDAPSSNQHSADRGLTPPCLESGLLIQSPANQTPAPSLSLTSAGSGNALRSAALGSRPTQQGSGAMQPSDIILPSDETWAQWKMKLKDLKAEAQKPPARLLAGLRVRLLEDACEHKDVLYLVVHQLYCQRSLDDRGRKEFPELRDQSCEVGLVKVQGLLEPNTPMGAPMTWKLARFPQPLEELKHQAWYCTAVGKISLCLTRLATRLDDFQGRLYESVYRRGYPPTVAELLDLLSVPSPVLVTVLFTAACRYLFETKSMAKLNKLFCQDLRANMLGQTSNLMEEYRKIPLMHRPARLRAPAPSASTFQNVPHPVAGVPVASVPSSGGQAAVASPATSVHSDSRSSHHPGQNSPRGLADSNVTAPQTVAGWQALQSPGYQCSPYSSPQQSPRQGQVTPGQPTQMQMFWYQGRWVQFNPAQIQQAPQGQLPREYYGHIRTAQAGTVQQQVQQIQAQTQQAYQARMRRQQAIQTQQAQGLVRQPSQVQMQPPAQATVPSNVPPLTSNSFQQPQPNSSQYGQTRQQPCQLPARPLGNTAQSDPSQGPLTQSPRTHLAGQGQLPPQYPRHLPTLLDNAPQRRQSQGPPAQHLPRPAQHLPQPARRLPQTPIPQPAPWRPLLPPLNYQLPQTVDPNPAQMALHQADLREPEKKLVEYGPNKEMTHVPLFQYLGGFKVQPKIIDLEDLRYDLTFSLPKDNCQRLPRLEPRGMGKRPRQVIQPGCFIFRLRCIKLHPVEQENAELLWSTKNTLWPSVLYIFVNGKEMFVRRKAHNGKDLPLDISEHLRSGENTVTIHLLPKQDECKSFKYAVAIESMHIGKFEAVRNLAGNTTADETRLNIQKRLTSSEDSDDLAVVTESLTISLIDPFMAQMFKIPVRTRDCKHLECFDHETFIMTRKNESGFAALNDNWRCPICNADARPGLLIVDKYFLAVREFLVMTNTIEGATAIQVKADGSWTLRAIRDESPNVPRSSRANKTPDPVLGKRKGDDDMGQGSDAIRPKLEPFPARRISQASAEPVVIELE